MEWLVSCKEVVATETLTPALDPSALSLGTNHLVIDGVAMRAWNFHQVKFTRIWRVLL